MEIRQAIFVSSYVDMRKCPPPNKPEFAFIGRSNVGKSSLINMITGQKKLAKVSVKPGKTQTINHFLINDSWYLVDLPGYGYASVSKSIKKGWGKMIENYLLNRENMLYVFILIDSRLAPQPIDMEFINWAGRARIPICLALTKTDKLPGSKLLESKKILENKILESWAELPPLLITSSVRKTGRQELIDFIETAMAIQN